MMPYQITAGAETMYFSDMLKIWTRALRVRSGEIGLFFDLWVDSFLRQSRTEIRLFAFLSAHDVLVVPWLVFPHIPPRICSELFSLPFTHCMQLCINVVANTPEDLLQTSFLLVPNACIL